MGNYLRLSDNSGLSIIATVMIMLILALFAAVAVSLVTTETGTGIQEERGIQAFYIADGGLQYTLKRNTYPYYTVSSPVLLGDSNGSFTVSVPTTSGLIVGETGTLNVSSTDGFITAPNGKYWMLMCGVASPTVIRMSSDCEKISADTKTDSTTFTILGRGKDSTDAAAQPSSAVVMMYTYYTDKNTTLSQNLVPGAKCTGASSKICIQAADLTKFATSGFIRVHYDDGASNNNEDIFYNGKSNDPGICGGCAACLGTDGCSRRAFDGGGNGTTTHSSSGPTIYQSEFSVLVTSKGVLSGAILSGNIQRVLQDNVMPLQDP